MHFVSSKRIIALLAGAALVATALLFQLASASSSRRLQVVLFKVSNPNGRLQFEFQEVLDNNLSRNCVIENSRTILQAREIHLANNDNLERGEPQPYIFVDKANMEVANAAVALMERIHSLKNINPTELYTFGSNSNEIARLDLIELSSRLPQIDLQPLREHIRESCTFPASK